MIAVGTAVANRPPRRSQRERRLTGLLPWVMASKLAAPQLRRTRPGSASRGVCLAAFPSGSPLPSTTSAPGRPGLFGGLAGTTGLSDFLRSCIEGVPPQRSPRGPRPRSTTPRTIPDGASVKTVGDRRISRFSRMEIPYVPGFFDRAGSTGDSRITPPAAWPSACYESVGTPNLISDFAAQ